MEERRRRQVAMKRTGAAVFALAFSTISIAAGSYGRPQSPARAPGPTGSSAKNSASASTAEFRTELNRYCVVCHNSAAKIGGLILDQDHVDLTEVPEQAEIWEKVEKKLRSGMMPPQGMPAPDAAHVNELASYLEDKLDQAAIEKPNPGPGLVRRLSRTEYGNAVRDLLALDIDVTPLLPADGYSDAGFDNSAEALSISPVLMEQYLSAAWKISALAVGTSKVASTTQVFRVRTDLSQDEHIEGLPVGTRGGILIRYNFPSDGVYTVRPKLWRNNTRQVRGLEMPSQVEVSLDGARIHLGEFGGPEDEAFSYNVHVVAGLAFEKRLEVTLPIKAGPHTIGVAFVRKSSAVPITFIQPFDREKLNTDSNTGIPELAETDIIGPVDPTGAKDTASRRRIFTCLPPDDGRDRDACARQNLTRLARLAYRRPATPTEINRLIGFYETGRKQGGGETGIETALSYLLVSPHFILRTESDPAKLTAGAVHPVSEYDLASRLSFFIWSSIPDAELLTLAGEGKLKDPLVLRQQIKRMMADPRASSLVTNFADEWLHIRNLKAANPIDTIFPDFDDNLRTAYQRETELFMQSIIEENRTVFDLLNANYTFINERLARQYGIPGIYGSQFRRVTLTDPNRFGLLGQGSILTVTSYGNRTSPVVRGKFILSTFMDNPPPPMPANVPPLNELVDPNKPQSMRERMQSHRANPVCANCHRLMDPIGFAMDNFDATGRWRTNDGGAPIDPSGVMANGQKVNGPADIRKAILAYPDIFVRSVTEALMGYALGRDLGPYDMPAVRKIVRDAAKSNYTFASLVLGIAQSTPFQMRVKPERQQQSQPGVASDLKKAVSNPVAVAQDQ